MATFVSLWLAVKHTSQHFTQPGRNRNSSTGASNETQRPIFTMQFVDSRKRRKTSDVKICSSNHTGRDERRPTSLIRTCGRYLTTRSLEGRGSTWGHRGDATVVTFTCSSASQGQSEEAFASTMLFPAYILGITHQFRIPRTQELRISDVVIALGL